ncbi:hypothetical protein G7054_g4074 [Neopestalotiopsis clavispora]|nr:hypothetical protein G7054_g4074 [Neopestalotiopsis clavispora]
MDDPNAHSMVLEAMKQKLSQESQRYRSEPFCVVDLGDIYDEYQRWTRLLPKGAAPENIIFANPCKKTSDLQYAQKVGVRKVTFDNEAELHKIRQWLPDAELVLRCRASDPSASYNLCSKFGATTAASVRLLRSAKHLGLSVIGVSFHIGSNAKDPLAFNEAIQTCRELFETGLDIGHEMHLLDIGGGFSTQSFDAMARVIRESLDRHFCGIAVEVVAEPGRLLVAGALTLACGIIGRRDALEHTEDKEGRHMIYLNDGVYGTFICNLFEPGPQPKVLRASGAFYPPQSADKYENYTIWGPTCDGTDCIAESVALPGSLTIDDWLYFPSMGGEFLILSFRYF